MVVLRCACTTSMTFDEKFPDLEASDAADGYKKNKTKL